MKAKNLITLTVLMCIVAISTAQQKQQYKAISGIYPHLAFYNNEGECGTGAVVPWANRLWVITYGPHMPYGSSDKLYEISKDLEMTVRPESVGGTPANRMIHRESNQLFIGPYAIDSTRGVRVISYDKMPGRHTGNARHLTDPENKIYYATMEEGFYEVDVNTLDVNMLYEDANAKQKKGSDISTERTYSTLPGAHGKGAYSGQGVMVYSNNGEASKEALTDFDIDAGVLAEWDGDDWTVVRRNQFVEVTGPGGIYGNENPETDPIWATGWDHKSILLGARDEGSWSFFRLPKASHSYDGGHGWNTEWPRIRDVGKPENPDYLMTMHGMFWKFPGTFSSSDTRGIRPRSAYLKVIGDFTRWNNQLVFGCDDSARKEFLNKRKAKGGIEGPGQSNSNLWFTSLEKPDQLGPKTAEGAVWLSEQLKAGEMSEPFLFAGWEERIAWIKNEGANRLSFTFEIDITGKGKWSEFRTISLSDGEAAMISFNEEEAGEWIRAISENDGMGTVHFYYATHDKRVTEPDAMFAGLAPVRSNKARGGLLYGLGNNERKLGVLAFDFEKTRAKETGYYELDAAMNLVKKQNDSISSFIRNQFEIPSKVVSIDEASVLVIDDDNRRWRLPKGDESFTPLTNGAGLRICREVATERDLFSCHGTFYELPAENADGYAKIRPVSSHNFRVHDYASYRGLLILTGLSKDAPEDNQHIIKSDDGKASIWAGAIDDLWKLGKPVGAGGPWKNSSVKANVPSDPYLIGFYNKRKLSLSHDNDNEVTFSVQVEPVGHGPWMEYKKVSVPAGETFSYEFPDDFESRWIRFVSDSDCEATAWLVYE